METITEIEITIKNLIEFCNECAKKGELELHWDGGNDSGSITLSLNSAPLADSPYEEKLLELADSVLDYGSWAGDFSAYGSAVYNPKTQMFEGTNSESSSVSGNHDICYEIAIPTHLKFSRMTIDISEPYDDGNPQVEVSFRDDTARKSGVISDELRAHATLIEDSLKQVLLDCELDEDCEWSDYLHFELKEFSVDDTNNLYLRNINAVQYSYEEDLENDVQIDLVKMLELDKKSE